jgi:hypothetical protein
LTYDPLRHVRTVGFSGVIFRRTFPEITAPGGLWDQAGEMYPAAGGRPVRGDMEYRWRNGVRVSFRHLEHPDSVFAWQGSQLCFIGLDELQHFAESQFFYLLSRNRSKCGIRPYVRATCNPDPGWLKGFLSPWVDEEYQGERALPGEIRWFTRIDGKVRWVPEGTPDAKSVTFIPASVYDNQELLRVNPDYVANLKALPEIEQARLLRGDWRVRREGLVYKQFERCIVDAPLRLQVPPTDGGLDWGWSNPFAAVFGFFDGDDCLWITGGRYRRQTSLEDHSQALPRGVSWWCDPADPESRLELIAAGHSVRPCVHRPTRGATGERRSPKMSGIAAVSARMETGRLKIVRCEGTAALIRELGLYRYDPEKASEEPIDEDNHTCDALRYLIVGHDRGQQVRPIQTPEQIQAEREAWEREERELAAERRRASWAARVRTDEERQRNPMDDQWWT